MANHYMTVVQAVYKQNKKRLFFYEKTVRRQLRQNKSAVISSPSLAGQKVNPVQAVLLARVHSSLRLPKTFCFSDIMKFAPPYSGGTAPVFHRTSLLGPFGHLYCTILTFML